MNLVVNEHNVFVIVIVTLLTSLILVPIVKKIAIHVNAMDEPNARKIHKVPMPRLGGLAIYLAFLFLSQISKVIFLKFHSNLYKQEFYLQLHNLNLFQ